MTIRITASTNPAIFECLDAVSYDMGMGAGHTAYHLADSWVGRLAIAEDALAGLSEDGRETLAMGEVEEANALCRTSPGVQVAYDLLNAFHDWCSAVEAADPLDPGAMP